MQQVFGPECRNPAHVRIDERIKQIFLDIHNELRNHQALGKNENFLLKPHVADMSTMVGEILNYHVFL